MSRNVIYLYKSMFPNFKPSWDQLYTHRHTANLIQQKCFVASTVGMHVKYISRSSQNFFVRFVFVYFKYSTTPDSSYLTNQSIRFHIRLRESCSALLTSTCCLTCKLLNGVCKYKHISFDLLFDKFSRS